MNNLEFTDKHIEIDTKILEQLEALENRRRIVNSHVNRLYKVIKEGGSFDSPIVVNKKGDVFRLIDGNHRLEAITKWIKENPEKNKIEALFVIYEGLTADQERKTFTKWNSGKKQSSDDFVQMYSSEIPILQMMFKSFPVNARIYNLQRKQRGIHFSSLMKAYFMSKVQFPIFQPYMGSAQKFVNDCIQLNKDDYEKLKDFVNFFTKVFGVMERENIYQTTTMLNCLMTIYFDNVEKLSEEELISRFKDRILGRSVIFQYALAGGRVATENLYNLLISELDIDKRNRLEIRNIGIGSATQDIPATTDGTMA